MIKQGDVFEGGEKLPLVEEFYTVQGEGFHTGKAAYFIRVGGCDVGCSWCDTKFSWNPSLHPVVPVTDIVDHALTAEARSVVVTGGEPLMAPLGPLTRRLKDAGVETFLETSGAYPLNGEWDWICLSPKRDAPPVPAIYKHAHELKVIIQHEEDFLWAEEQATRVGDACFLYLQPEWSRRDIMIPRIIAYVKHNPRWMISLQAHKYMRIP
ncbi:MAG: 7-carboxy-7-deazaguanine synthase QueE [Bacteroidales bacterium]